MRIQVICPHFEPDMAPTGLVITEIVRGLVAGGHQVEVVTALPWYANHKVDPAWQGRLARHEQTAWGSISRVYPFPSKKNNIWLRACGFLGFAVLATFSALWRVSSQQRKQPIDLVLVMSPPLTLGLAGWLSAGVRRVPLVLNVQDVFPDVAIDVGVISNRGLIRLLRGLERWIYRRCAAVTVLSEDLRSNIETKLGIRCNTLVRVIPNFVDTEAIQPQTRDNAYRTEFSLGERTVVMYAGNLGFSQPLELLVEAARELSERGQTDDAVFVLNGDGARRQELELLAAGLQNVLFVDYQPVERLPEVLAAADVHVIALRRGLAHSSVPSKLYSVLAAGRAVLASVDGGSEIAEVVSSQRAGIVVPPEDQEAFTAAVLRLVSSSSADRDAMGFAGRRFVLGWVSPERVAHAYASLFEELQKS